METGCRYKGLQHRQWSLCLHPCCSTHHLPNFPSLHPPYLFILFHPSLSRSSSLALPLSFSFNLTFLPLSFTRSAPLPRSHISASATPFIIISTCRITRFISLLSLVHVSTRMSFNILPLSISAVSCPHLFFFLSSVCSLDTSTQERLRALSQALNWSVTKQF